MDELLAKAGNQAVTFAIRSGISIASAYTFKTVSKFLVKIPKDDATRLERLRTNLETRIEIVSSAIDLIKLVAARGNTNLESTLRLTSGLEQAIDMFDIKIQKLTTNYNENDRNKSIKEAEAYINDLVLQIEDIIPLINLSLTTSGANLNISLPQQISPGRLLQASNYIIKSNELFDNKTELQVGPTFQVTLFSIFYHLLDSQLDNKSTMDIMWKEDIKRAMLSIWRRPVRSDFYYDYYIKINENFDDGRYHNLEEEKAKTLKLNIDQIIKLFFSASGKLLKLEERSSPVLVIKFDKLMTNSNGKSNSSTKNIEWFALGNYEAEYESEEEEDNDNGTDKGNDDEFHDAISGLNELNNSLSLLEYLLRLASLQNHDGKSILEVKDEKLSIYLNDENPNSIDTRRYDVTSITNGLDKIEIK